VLHAASVVFRERVGLDGGDGHTLAMYGVEAMSHIAIQERLDGKAVDPMDRVSDAGGPAR
jgi:hypothetical protein